MRLFIAFFCLLAVTACDLWSPTEPAPVNAEVTIRIGQAAQVTEAGVSIRFEAVVADHRCPGDAICVDSGNATLRVAMDGGRGGRRSYELQTYNTQPVRHGDLRLEVVELAPYPFASLPFDPSEYRVTVRVSR